MEDPKAAFKICTYFSLHTEMCTQCVLVTIAFNKTDIFVCNERVRVKLECVRLTILNHQDAV